MKAFKDRNKKIIDSLKNIPKDISIMAKSHYDSNFTKQGFDGVKWQEVQRRMIDTKTYKYSSKSSRTRAILSGKSKRLAKSLYIKSYSMKRIVIQSSSLYAKYHNYGTIKIPQRKFLGYSKVLNNKILNLLKKLL